MRDGRSCDGVQIQGWLVGFAAIFGRRPATSLETKLYPHAPYGGDRKGRGVQCDAKTKGGISGCKDTNFPIQRAANDPPPFGEKKYCNFFGVEYPDVKISLLRKERQHVMDMGLSVGICVYSVAKLD